MKSQVGRLQAFVAAVFDTCAALVGILVMLMAFSFFKAIWGLIADNPAPTWLGIVVGPVVLLAYFYREARRKGCRKPRAE